MGLVDVVCEMWLWVVCVLVLLYIDGDVLVVVVMWDCMFGFVMYIGDDVFDVCVLVGLWNMMLMLLDIYELLCYVMCFEWVVEWCGDWL